MGAFLERHAGKPRVMHFGELDSDKWRQYAERSAFPMSAVYAREQRTLLEFERRIARASSENVVCTPLEERVFREQIPGASCTVLRNGVDLERFHPRDNAPRVGEIVFTGVMNYHPNAEGCAWFAREILPQLRAVQPEAHFTIVGASPNAAVRRLAGLPGVAVTGAVPDTRAYLRHAAVAVAPLRIARGIQNKVLEALAMALPLVGTTSATQGVEGVAGRDYLVADEPGAFVAALAHLLHHPARARELGAAGRSFVERSCDWESTLAPLDALLERCAKSG
jgi:sugar transferase (PEP-CTERM/EpsH1 system associated)